MTESTDFGREPIVPHRAIPTTGLVNGSSTGNGHPPLVHELPSPAADDAVERELEAAGDVPDELRKEYACGCGPCRPRRLQIFADKKFFTFLLCLYAFLQSAVVSG